jgi:hypothetical protein
MGISAFWTLVISLVCATAPYLLYGTLPFEAFVIPMAVTWVLYFIQNRTLNYLIRQKIRRALYT